MKTSKAVGIDLGTTNSVIAMVGNDNEIICRTDRSGRKTFPSVVVYDRRSESLKSGQIAFNRRGTSPEPIVSIKSHMGDSEYRAKSGPIEMTSVEVATTILGEMKTQMQDFLDSTPGYENYLVDRAVITIPAYFASNAREATAKAGELAGLKVEFTLQEPTSAVLYYCQKNDIEEGIFLVYDLGGGTFDVSVVKVDGPDATVLGIAGNNYLGGDNFDELLAKHLLEELRQDPDAGYDLDPFDPNHDAEDHQRLTKLKLVAETIKKALTSKSEHYEEFSGIFADRSGAQVNLALEISRDQFEDMIRPLLETTIAECHRALAKAEADFGVTLSMVDGVLLVGGSTHIPLVSDVIVEAFTSRSLPEDQRTKQEMPLKEDPDMAVGYGAAIAAAGAGTTTLDDAAMAVVSGDTEAIEALGEALVLAPEFRPGSGFDSVSVVDGVLKALHGTLPDTVYAVVTRAGGGFSAEFPVAPDGSFAFHDLMAPGDVEPYACEFRSGGALLGTATFDAAIRNARRASVALSRNYFIETFDEASGGTELVELMRQGQELPISRDYEFSTHPANEYFAELRFFEESDFLKQVTITFAERVPPGTRVKLSLACNLQSQFSARAEVAGMVVDTQFEPSPPPPLPTRNDVDRKLADAREKTSMISEPGERIVSSKQLDRLAAEVDSALDESDAGKARDKLTELDRLLDTLRPKGLKPAREIFEAMVAECEKLNGESDKGSPEGAADIQAAAGAGRRAYDVEDQAALSKAIGELESIKKSLEPDGDRGGDGGGEPPVWMLCQHFGRQTAELMDTADARTDLPAQFRADQMADLPDDRAVLRQAISETRLPMPNEEAQPHWDIIRVLYQKWERIANITGTVTR
ncbi:MAG: Hsp70 family protein [Bifidobacteriaceae bacterium]|jgi:molecular chaperone DnaK|nr:Hsp70 family protein [Bifidobacteriaceae bacterium]